MTVTEDEPPWHCIVDALAVATNVDGAVMVTDVVVVQLLASVTVKLCVPAPRENVPFPEYGGVPPPAVTVTVELLLLQVIAVALADAVSAGGSEMVTEAVSVQLLASVTVKVCVPADFVNVPVPVYGAVPPLAVTVTVELPPLQAIAEAPAVTPSADGSVIVTDVVAVQLFASVTVKL